jgi:uncharacterized protein
MDFAEIIQDFAHSERVPVAAIRAATAEAEGFVLPAIDLLRRVRSGEATPDEEQAISVLVHVLGEIGDERALPPLLEVLSLPPEMMDKLLGGTITESLPRILMRLGGSGAEGLQRLIENRAADDFVRNAAFDAWIYLVLTGHIARDAAHAYVVDYPERVSPPPGDFGWVSWVDAVAALGFDDLRDPVARVFADKIQRDAFGLLPMAHENFTQSLEKTLRQPDGWRRDRQFQPFEDTVKELSTWYGYSERYIRSKKAPQLAVPESHGPAVNEYRHIGRNDPCPCGSGKKFKKCCLQSLQ